jgi:hypothetical protein
MSYYKGNVAKMTWHGDSGWDVVSVYFLDTDCDENIHTNFMHNTETRATIIPVDIIENFDPATTKKVRRTFDKQLGIEHWKAIT